MQHWCAACGQLRPVCCGDNTNGFWCGDCCQHPYDERDQWMDDGEEEPEHQCFEDTCVCTDGMCGDSEDE